MLGPAMHTLSNWFEAMSRGFTCSWSCVWWPHRLQMMMMCMVAADIILSMSSIAGVLNQSLWSLHQVVYLVSQG